ncbi:MAG: tRNA (adenosine(37)-N6)-dimethylallyltransferase MiaA [Eubacteriales bacterium]|nr:tRNA (adenosine(37)-N6)-dimethylallyltransferase MiaA [Eubacteriales bacterium]
MPNYEVCIPIITGPTASGKSALALAYAKRHAALLISADSMQVYRNLNIGTAKASPLEQSRVEHALIDICELNENYSVVQFQQDAKRLIYQAIEVERPCVICGGSAQYIKALVEDQDYQALETNDNVRSELESRYREFSNQELWDELKLRDPLRAEALHPNDRRRVLRAIEIHTLTSRCPSQLNPLRQTNSSDPCCFKSENSDQKPLKYKIFCPHWERDLLYDRINQRVLHMFEEGVIEEAWLCYRRHLEGRLSQTAAQAIAYKEFFPYFSGEGSLTDAIAQLQQASRRYAKRQLTHWRRYPGIEQIDLRNIDHALAQIEQCLERSRTEFE